MFIEKLTSAIHDAMKIVTSADKAYALLRERGYDVRRADVRDTWRAVGQKEYWSTVIETWGIDRKVPKAWETEHNLLRRAQYEYTFSVTMRDRETGAEREQIVGVLSDERMSFASAWTEAEDIIERYKEIFNADVIDFAVFGLFRRQ